jgi:CheY-like chemotaxis protein
MEYRMRRADGEYRWVLNKGVPRFAPGGPFAGYIGSAIDITDLKRSQEEALSREKLQALVSLTRGIAHDFNNMVGSIFAQAELAEADLAEGSAPTDEIRQIKGVAVRASEMVRELMVYSGQETVTLEPVDLSPLVEDMSELLRASISKNSSLQLDLCRDLPRVQGNATQIRQLVMNLILNASQAIGENHGSIHVSTSASESADSAHGRCDFVRLLVSDTGCGISEEEKARIFEPFFTTKSHGHGLGLSVVQGIVRSHGGVLNVLSMPGHGATFEVLFQAAKADSGVHRSAPFEGAPKKSFVASGAVLLVEDEDPLRSATAIALRKRGFSVITAADGRMAVETFRAERDKIGVVILDMGLPVLSGQEVYRQIRMISPDMKILCTSGYAPKLKEAALSDVSAPRFVQKPYTISDLIEGIHEALIEGGSPPSSLM